jgi:NAD(P)-dependent dehydrogenase (short-subunit alcohol dehydrogenase family)
LNANESEETVNVNDKVVIVTGGGRGLGRVYALGLAAEGARVVVADIIDTSEVVDEILAAGGRAIGVSVDITDDSLVESLVAITLAEYGALDVLVNNAAYFRAAEKGTFEDVPLAELERCLEVNVVGTWKVIRAVLPHMKSVGAGKIITVSSASYWKGVSGTGPHYLTSKGAINGLARALARELGPHGISVNNLVPDAIPEPTQSDSANVDNDRQTLSRCFRRRQLPKDMVGTLVYLCSDGSDFVTGQSFHVNGGSYLT